MKRTFSKIFAFVFSLLTLLLSGCGTPNIGKDYSLDESKGTGIMLASMTQAGLPSQFNMFVDLRGVDNKYNNAVPITNAFASSDWACPFMGTRTEAKPCGRLAVIELPQGEYEFYSWHGEANDGKLVTTVKSRQEFSKRFKVNAGKVVYVGNIHFSVGGGSYAFKIIDSRDRDFPLFSSKYPKIPSDKIQASIIQ